MKCKVMSYFKKLIMYLRKRIYTNEVLILYKHKVHIYQSSPITIVNATGDNIYDILHFQDKRYIHVFNKFLHDGDIGYLAYFNGKCVHRSWVKVKPQKVYLHPFVPFQLNDGEIYIHYCETASEARGNNIYPAVLSKIAKDFSGKRILICSNEKNHPSKRGIEKAGFVEILRLRVIVIFGIKTIKNLGNNYTQR